MKRIEKIAEMQRWSDMFRQSGRRIGFVPTMGYLHQGHLSLIDEARRYCDVVVVSVFVNPAQFAPGEDYDIYPRDIDRDQKRAAARGADILFHPSAEEMYPGEHLTWVNVEKITGIMCGASRREHFRGVTTVVMKLFNIVKPHIAVFGQKDAQQAAVVKKMVRDLNMDVEIRVAPVIRESDGLAMSSRNVRLKEGDRKNAAELSRILFGLKEALLKGRKPAELLEEAKNEIRAIPGADLEYLEMRTYPELEETDSLEGACVIALAVHFGDVRLIDNVLIEKTS